MKKTASIAEKIKQIQLWLRLAIRIEERSEYHDYQYERMAKNTYCIKKCWSAANNDISRSFTDRLHYIGCYYKWWETIRLHENTRRKVSFHCFSGDDGPFGWSRGIWQQGSFFWEWSSNCNRTTCRQYGDCAVSSCAKSGKRQNRCLFESDWTCRTAD